MSPKESEKITAAYKKEHNRLLGYIRSRIPYHLEAEDIMQDVFYQLTIGFNGIRKTGTGRRNVMTNSGSRPL